MTSLERHKGERRQPISDRRVAESRTQLPQRNSSLGLQPTTSTLTLPKVHKTISQINHVINTCSAKGYHVTHLVTCCVHLLDALFDLVLTLLDVFTLLQQTTSHFAEEVLDLTTTRTQ